MLTVGMLVEEGEGLGELTRELTEVVVLELESFRKHYGQLVQRLKRPALLMLEEGVVEEELTVMEVAGELKLKVVGEELMAEEGSR